MGVSESGEVNQLSQEVFLNKGGGGSVQYGTCFASICSLVRGFNATLSL